mmetsp:Transcript_8597/g.13205  ORF Transcript_8597/g.13205 Transcript_8597/m.13205 type:complete len:578 (+) Transcript_8597:44-1777(+)
MSSSLQSAALELLGEPYARKLSKTALKAGYMHGLSGGDKWQRRYFVLKPTTLLYSFGSSGDEEPLGCVDIEGFERCDCGGLEEDGSVVIELVRSKGQTLRLKANEAEWYACLKNETYGRLKDTAAILRKQRDEFASHINSLEEATASAESRAERAEKLHQLADMRLSYLIDSIAKAAGALLGNSDPIVIRNEQNDNKKVEDESTHSPSEQSLVAAVQRVVEHSHNLETTITRTREKYSQKRDALEANCAALLALIAAERRKTRSLERANTKLHASINELKAQRKALCKALRTQQAKNQNSMVKADQEESNHNQEEHPESTISISSDIDDASSEVLSESKMIPRDNLLLNTSFQDDNNIISDDDQQEENRIAFRNKVRSRILAVFHSRRKQIEFVKEAQATPMKHNSESKLLSETTIRSPLPDFDQSIDERAALAAQKPDLDTGPDMLEHWLDDDDEDDTVLRVTYVRPRIGIVFAVANGAIKVSSYTDDYDPDLPRPAPESLLVAINGHPLAPEPAVNFRTLKQAKRPLILDFSTIVSKTTLSNDDKEKLPLSVSPPEATNGTPTSASSIRIEGNEN